jgi:hypothetical protein
VGSEAVDVVFGGGGGGGDGKGSGDGGDVDHRSLAPTPLPPLHGALPTQTLEKAARDLAALYTLAPLVLPPRASTGSK